MSCTLLLIVYYVFTFRHYFTSSKLATTDYQRLTEALVQIRNAISILNVINQQISRSIRVMLFLFFLVHFYIFLSFVCAKVIFISHLHNITDTMILFSQLLSAPTSILSRLLIYNLYNHYYSYRIHISQASRYKTA